jgi:hypothetical protein
MPAPYVRSYGATGPVSSLSRTIRLIRRAEPASAVSWTVPGTQRDIAAGVRRTAATARCPVGARHLERNAGDRSAHLERGSAVLEMTFQEPGTFRTSPRRPSAGDGEAAMSFSVPGTVTSSDVRRSQSAETL